MRGYYVVGEYTSVAWCKTYREALELTKQLNYRGGTHYKVEPAKGEES